MSVSLDLSFFSDGKLYFFINEKNSIILKIWAIIFIVLVDVYIERFTGSNIFGFGKLEINGVPQPYADRIISFFRTEPVAGAFLCGFLFYSNGTHI